MLQKSKLLTAHSWTWNIQLAVRTEVSHENITANTENIDKFIDHHTETD